jgi:HlyD family secretion protein
LIAAVATLFLVVCGVGGWASTTQIAGAVVASGVLVVDSNVKKVQHPTGGVVQELLVRDGDRVKAGDVLLRLDDTQTRANLAIVTKTLDEFYARRSRDTAELLGADEIDFPAGLLARSSEKEIANALEGERRLFAARKASRAGQKAQLEQRIVQSKDEIGGLLTQNAARQEQVSWIEKELVGVNDLWHQNLVPYTRVTSLEREAARLRGEIGQLEASVAQTQGKISETELSSRSIRIFAPKPARTLRRFGRRSWSWSSERLRQKINSSASIFAPRRTAWCCSWPPTPSAAISVRVSRSC